MRFDPEEQKEENLRVLRQMWPNLVVLVVVIVCVFILDVPIAYVLAGLGVYILIDSYRQELKRGKKEGWLFRPWRQLATTYLYILFLFGLNYFFGGYGLIGLFAIVIIITGLIIWRRWDAYLYAKHRIERIIFDGKTIKEMSEEKDEQRHKETGGRKRRTLEKPNM